MFLSVVALLGVVVILSSFFLSLSRLLNCLVVMENLNILILFVSLVFQWDHMRIFFIVLIVMFTIEVTLGLVVLTRLWSFSALIDTVGR